MYSAGFAPAAPLLPALAPHHVVAAPVTVCSAASSSDRFRSRRRQRSNVDNVETPLAKGAVLPVEKTETRQEKAARRKTEKEAELQERAARRAAVLQTSPLDAPDSLEIESGWNKRGRSSALRRTVEIWTFFFKFLLAERRVQKMDTTDEKSLERARLGALLKNGLLRLGPTFIKLGQLLSTRVDVLPKEYIKELTILQDRVPGFGSERAIRVVEEDLGRKIEDIFDSFDTAPIAAASLGQVHRGVIDGQEVAVKIQRQGLRDLFDVDLKNLKLLARLLDKVDPKNDGASRDWVTIYDESARLLYEEIDYIGEGQRADRFRRNFEDYDWVKVPRVDWDHTASRVLTMEYVPGVKINRIKEIESLGIDTKVLARRSGESYLTQVLRHGFFHCDPHPGNIAVSPENGGTIVYYDFGMMSELPPTTKAGLVDLIFGVYEGEAGEICDSLVAMGVLRPNVDRVSIEKVGRYFLDNFRQSYSAGNQSQTKEQRKEEMKGRLARVGEDLLSVADDEPFRFPAVFTFVFRAFTTLEGVGKALDKKYDLTIIAAPFVKELVDLRDGSAAVTLLKSFRKSVGWRNEDIGAVVTQPRKIAYIEQMLRRMESGELKPRVRVLEAERSFKRMGVVQESMAFGMIATTFMNIALVLSTAGAKFVVQSRLAWVTSAMLGLKALIALVKLRQLDNRFRKYVA